MGGGCATKDNSGGVLGVNQPGQWRINARGFYHDLIIPPSIALTTFKIPCPLEWEPMCVKERGNLSSQPPAWTCQTLWRQSTPPPQICHPRRPPSSGADGRGRGHPPRGGQANQGWGYGGGRGRLGKRKQATVGRRFPLWDAACDCSPTPGAFENWSIKLQFPQEHSLFGIQGSEENGQNQFLAPGNSASLLLCPGEGFGQHTC